MYTGSIPVLASNKINDSPDFCAYRDGGLASPAFAILNAFTANRHPADILEPTATRVNRNGCHADPPKNLAARMRHHGAFGVADRSGPVWDYNFSSITNACNMNKGPVSINRMENMLKIMTKGRFILEMQWLEL